MHSKVIKNRGKSPGSYGCFYSQAIKGPAASRLLLYADVIKDFHARFPFFFLIEPFTAPRTCGNIYEKFYRGYRDRDSLSPSNSGSNKEVAIYLISLSYTLISYDGRDNICVDICHSIYSSCFLLLFGAENPGVTATYLDF